MLPPAAEVLSADVSILHSESVGHRQDCEIALRTAIHSITKMQDAHVKICELLSLDGVSLDAVRRAIDDADRTSGEASHACAAARTAIARGLDLGESPIYSPRRGMTPGSLSSAEKLRTSLSKISAELDKCMHEGNILENERTSPEFTPLVSSDNHEHGTDNDKIYFQADAPYDSAEPDIKSIFSALRQKTSKTSERNSDVSCARARLEELASLPSPQ